MSVRRGTVHSIQSLRFVAAMMVVVFHAHQAFVLQLGFRNLAQEDFLFGIGVAGVHIFFVISGYIMYLTSFSRGAKFSSREFLIRRFIRIYPTYWCFVLLYLVTLYFLDMVPSLSDGQVVGVIALAPGNSSLVIGPAWTLAYEVFFYIMFAILMRLGPDIGPVALTASFVTSIAVGLTTHPKAAALAMITNSLLLEFLAGVWIGKITGSIALPRAIGWMAAASGGLGFCAGLLWRYDAMPSAISWGGPSALLIFGAVVLEQTDPVERGGVVRRLSKLGDSSYSLYLCHILLITLTIAGFHTLGWKPALWALLVISPVLYLVFAEVFFRLLERPMVGWLQQITARQRHTPAEGAPRIASR